MKNCLLKYIKRRVGEKLLRLLKKNRRESIDDAIMREIILGLVLDDLNLVGGRTITVPMEKTKFIKQYEDGFMIEVPPEYRNNGHITSVQHIGEEYERYYENELESLLDVNHNRYDMDNVTLTVVGLKYIYVQGDMSWDDLRYKDLTLETGYTDAFESINGHHCPTLGEVAVKGTEMILYNKRLDLTDLMTNVPIIDDAILLTIQSYSDSVDEYSKGINTLAKVSFVTQKKKLSRLIDYTS